MDGTFFSTPEEIYSQNSVSVEGIHPQTVPNPLIESEGLGFGHQTYAISPVPSVLHPFTPWHSQRENFSNLVDFQEPDNRCKSVQIMTPAAYYADKFERYVYDNHSIDQNQFLERYIAKWETSTRFPEIKNPGFQSFSPIESLGGSNMRLLSSSSMDFPYSNVSKQSNNELSLSLATTRINVNSDQYSDAKLGSDQASYSSKDHSKIGPAADFSKQIFGSMYLKAVQEILAQIASYSLENLDIGAGMTSGVSWFRNSEDEFSAFDNGRLESETQTAVNRLEVESKKSQLLSLLQAVDDQYNHCLDEIHTVVSAFHAATEIDPQLHARFALKTVSFHYKNLRERLSSRILELGSVLEAAGDVRGKEKAMEDSFVQQHLAFQQLTSKRHNQLWRPQRGLPEKSVSVLRAWMFQNFLHPYPKDAEKHLLAVKSGLSRNQVSNWFINARVRLWKPMIEEMYTELNRRKAQQDEEGNEGSSTRNAGISSTSSHQRFKMIQDELKP